MEWNDGTNQNYEITILFYSHPTKPNVAFYESSMIFVSDSRIQLSRF